VSLLPVRCQTERLISGALGSGLMILSRFPIISSRIYRYPLNGTPLHVIQGDWYVGKSAAAAVIDLGEAGIAEVFNTHVSIQLALI
jgi:sphingomyelin phosphodiesterase 2